MKHDPEDHNKLLKSAAHYSFDEDGEGGDGEASGGKSGTIEFVDYLANPKSQRDDLAKPLLSEHERLNEGAIVKNKTEIENRKAQRAASTNKKGARAGTGSGTSYGMAEKSAYETFPPLMNAQFQGADKQTTPSPSEHDNLANQEQKQNHELQNRPQYTHQPKPSFNPKPMMP